MTSPLSRRRFLAALAAAPVVAACGGGKDEAATTTTAPTTTSTAPATTTTVVPTTPPPPPPPGGVGLLSGLAVEPALAARPALVVKIDNADGPGGRARPQSGIVEAEVVFEEMVEGSVTRFAALFQAADAGSVGPVRSARDTDIEIVSCLNRPLFAWSGGNQGVSARIRGSNLIDIGYDVRSGAYRRRGDRRAPHNLYTSTPELFGLAPGDAAPPPPLFTFRAPGEAPAGVPAAGVSVSFRNPDGLVAALAEVEHHWDATAAGYTRLQRGTPHVDEAGNVVQPANVVVQFVRYAPDGSTDSAGNRVFIAELVGEGDAWVLTGGNVVEARWSKPSREAVTTYVDAAGAPVGLTPGRTWILLPPPNGARLL